MNQKAKLKIFFSFTLISIFILGGCGKGNSLNYDPIPTFSQTPSPTKASIPSVTMAITTTPTLDNKSIIITPDDVFSLHRLTALSTPDTENFCEHLPPPQIVANPNRLSLLSGRFVLCS